MYWDMLHGVTSLSYSLFKFSRCGTCCSLQGYIIKILKWTLSVLISQNKLHGLRKGGWSQLRLDSSCHSLKIFLAATAQAADQYSPVEPFKQSPAGPQLFPTGTSGMNGKYNNFTGVCLPILDQANILWMGMHSFARLQVQRLSTRLQENHIFLSFAERGMFTLMTYFWRLWISPKLLHAKTMPMFYQNIQGNILAPLGECWVIAPCLTSTLLPKILYWNQRQPSKRTEDLLESCNEVWFQTKAPRKEAVLWLRKWSVRSWPNLRFHSLL